MVIFLVHDWRRVGLLYLHGVLLSKSIGGFIMENDWTKRDNAGEFGEGREKGFSGWADEWYAEYRLQVQPSTYSNYRYTLRILKNYFGTCAVERIRPMDINKFHAYLQESGLSKSYVTKCRAMLIQIFDYLEMNEIIPSNPARKARWVKITPVFTLDEQEETNKDAFTQEEISLLKKYLPDTLIGHSIRLLLGTGMRVQEILALQARDIAEDGSSIHINKAVKTVNGKPELGSAKSRKSKRIVPVPADYRADALYLRENAGNLYVWTSIKRENGLYDVGSFRRRYYYALKSVAGVRKLSPHCCRHTYVSNLEKRGVPMELISRLAGHSKIDTTNGYLHAEMSTLFNAVSVLNETKETIRALNRAHDNAM